MRIRELMNVRPESRDIGWLKASLQSAVELEFSTVPPYLCAMWSIQDQTDPVQSMILGIVLQEMLHMGLACNMLTTIGGTPSINAAGSVPTYPGHLPGGVRPELVVGLQGLTKDVVKDVFMQIEYPEFGPIALIAGETYPTIGAFYDAILAAFQLLPPGSITGARQLTSGGVGLYTITSLADADKAIKEIKEQGEGTRQSPEQGGFGSGLAHYYTFAEIYHERTLVQGKDGRWTYTGTPIPFPDVYPMAQVPAGGYPQSQDFDKAFSAMLGNLQAAWSNGDQSQLSAAVQAMRTLSEPARALMQIPLPDRRGTYGPDFRLVT